MTHHTDSAFTPDEMRRLRRLIDEDDIRRLAMLYAQYMDHGYLERMRDIFTDDIVCEYGPYGEWVGLDTVIHNYHGVKEDLGGKPFAAMHSAGSTHWIEFIDADHSVGRRQLVDLLLTREADENPILWLALYDEQYRRTDAGWRISRTSLQFFWPERHISGDFPGDFPGPLPL